MSNKTEKKMKIDIVLIHGAWQGSWVWQQLTPLLEENSRNEDIRCHAIDLPGNGADNTPAEDVCIELYIRHIEERIASIDNQIILIAHSGAGVIATAIGERQPKAISKIIYIAGMMLPPDMYFSDLMNQMLEDNPELSGIEPHLQWSEDGMISVVPPEAAANIFLNNIDYEVAVAAARKLTPQATSGLALATYWSADRFGKIPRTYIECSNDLSVKLPVQRRMQQLVPGAKSISIDADHAPQMSAPNALADILLADILGNYPSAC